LTYVGNSGDAQYVPASGGAPALAQLYTPDSGLSDSADSPAVFVQGPLGDLSGFTASYDLYSSSGPVGTSPYWILWVNDPSEAQDIAIIGMGGPTLNGTSEIHVYDPNNVAGSYWGDTLSFLDSQTYGASAYTFGNMTVDWAGVEIGTWNNGDATIPASAEFDSITVPSVPEGGSGSLYLLLAGAACFGAMVLTRRLGSASAQAN
jgi:hypothetical protein